MKKTLLAFSFLLTTNCLAQGTTYTNHEGKTLISITIPNKAKVFTTQLNQLRCDSIAMAHTCQIAQKLESDDFFNIQESDLYKLFHKSQIQQIHQMAKEKFVNCRKRYNQYKTCMGAK